MAPVVAPVAVFALPPPPAAEPTGMNKLQALMHARAHAHEQYCGQADFDRDFTS